MGRPRIEIDREDFEKLCFMHCTLKEIAGWFKCSEDTIERWCKRELKMTFAESYEKYSASGNISLRRFQWKLAETNVTMAIWLGKQYLGQSDKQDVAISTHDDDSVKEMEKYFEAKKATGVRPTVE